MSPSIPHVGWITAGPALIIGKGQLTESSQVSVSVAPGELLHAAGPLLFQTM